jgi:hypothetical protein
VSTVVDGRTVLKCIEKFWWENVDWIQLAQDNDQRQACVGTVIIFRVPQGEDFLH